MRWKRDSRRSGAGGERVPAGPHPPKQGRTHAQPPPPKKRRECEAPSEHRWPHNRNPPPHRAAQQQSTTNPNANPAIDPAFQFQDASVPDGHPSSAHRNATRHGARSGARTEPRTPGTTEVHRGLKQGVILVFAPSPFLEEPECPLVWLACQPSIRGATGRSQAGFLSRFPVRDATNTQFTSLPGRPVTGRDTPTPPVWAMRFRLELRAGLSPQMATQGRATHRSKRLMFANICTRLSRSDPGLYFLSH